ncbi:unnamed protein product [Coffea canephora]|uniref:Uncharacterized protein n=1 Tax=Coffea canephora TaxID=49390 RepID=A0A068TUE2_COFCA|nr:unnamed protein product [Coffea canephora]
MGSFLGNKFRMSLGLPNLYIISVKGIKGRLNRLPSAIRRFLVYVQVKKGWSWGFAVPTVAMFCSIVILVVGFSKYRYQKPMGSAFTRFVQVIARFSEGDQGFAITGPIGKECADLWPRIASAATKYTKYFLQVISLLCQKKILRSLSKSRGRSFLRVLIARPRLTKKSSL